MSATPHMDTQTSSASILPSLTIDTEHCIRCGQCVGDCPVRVISMQANEYPALVEGREHTCLRCQHCLAICPTAALSFMDISPMNSTPLKGRLPETAKLVTLLQGRRSVRKFKPAGLMPETIDRLLTATAHAPTGKNNEQVLFTVVDNAETMNTLRHVVMDAIAEHVQNNTLPEEFGYFKSLLRPWKKGTDLIFRNAPHMLITSAPDDGPSYKEDPIIALSHFELVAQSMGIGTLWCGFALWALQYICPEIGKSLGIPENHHVGYTMLFGSPAVHYHRTVQRSAMHVNRVSFPAKMLC